MVFQKGPMIFLELGTMTTAYLELNYDLAKTRPIPYPAYETEHMPLKKI